MLIQKLKQHEIDEKIKKNLGEKNNDEPKVSSGVPQVQAQINEKKVGNNDKEAIQLKASVPSDQIGVENQDYEDEYFDHDYEDEE